MSEKCHHKQRRRTDAETPRVVWWACLFDHTTVSVLQIELQPSSILGASFLSEMDEHGLPIVGTGVDYTKVNQESDTFFNSSTAVFAGTCARAQEHARVPQLVRHSDCSVPQQVLGSL